MMCSFPVGAAADIGEVEKVPKGGQQVGVEGPVEVAGKLQLVEGDAGEADGCWDGKGREF